MKTYLYLLPFLNGKYFKIGITTTSSSRVMKHDKTYGIDLDNAMVIYANKSTYIKSLELELLSLYPKTYDNFKCQDGYTEIRDISFLDDCIDYIKNKPKELGFVIENFKNYNKIKSSDEEFIELKTKIEELENENKMLKLKLTKKQNAIINAKKGRGLAALLTNYKD